jgi:peptidoglycan/LPS O-acetylase OafA/YrhL
VSVEATTEAAREDTEATGPAAAGVHFAGFELLRAIAAAMVVVHHADSLAGAANAGRLHTLAAVGDAGVSVFFVLSGFLIYRPFVAAHATDRSAQHPLAFWWRRLLRIVPAYWLVLTFFWALGSFSLGSDWWRFYLFLQIYSPETALGGVVQAWSLCTEMTFYLLVPGWAALVGWTLRRAGRGPTPGAHVLGAGVLWLGGFASRLAIEAWWPSRRGLSFNWLPTNLDLFATGMALAALSVWAAQHPRRADAIGRAAAPAGAWWAAAAVLYAWYAYRVGPAPSFAVGYEGWFWHRRQLVLAAFTVLLLVPAVFGPQDRGLVRRVWSWRPLAWVGTVSYGLYLWHFDWMKRSIAAYDGFGGLRWRGWAMTAPGDSSLWLLLAVGMGVGLLFAAASWYLLEQPLQRYKRALGPR